jgi:hypothetical protein
MAPGTHTRESLHNAANVVGNKCGQEGERWQGNCKKYYGKREETYFTYKYRPEAGKGVYQTQIFLN